MAFFAVCTHNLKPTPLRQAGVAVSQQASGPPSGAMSVPWGPGPAGSGSHTQSRPARVWPTSWHHLVESANSTPGYRFRACGGYTNACMCRRGSETRPSPQQAADLTCLLRADRTGAQAPIRVNAGRGSQDLSPRPSPPSHPPTHHHYKPQATRTLALCVPWRRAPVLTSADPPTCTNNLQPARVSSACRGGRGRTGAYERAQDLQLARRPEHVPVHQLPPRLLAHVPLQRLHVVLVTRVPASTRPRFRAPERRGVERAASACSTPKGATQRPNPHEAPPERAACVCV